ncbi:dihydrodipicolinate synthase family protein [Methylopila henanensis]|uniref:Dihydrodipicolinate synthase family protein n=1 Tax=Methylopila henanensis TaxID=873516 RepID=A0ABW4KCC2_9HYPH
MRGVRSGIGGCIAALPSFFTSDGRHLDEAAVDLHARRLLAQGVGGLVCCGAVGEGATLTFAERSRVVAVAVEASAGRTPVIADVSACGTRAAVELARAAKEAGADAAMVVTPWYSRPTQRGVIRHFEDIAQAAVLPVIAAADPRRAAIDVEPASAWRLQELPGVIGFADMAGCAERLAERKRRSGGAFVWLTGDDASALSFHLAGGDGVVSAAANLAPAACAAFAAACRDGDFKRAVDLHRGLAALVGLLGRKPCASLVKAALATADPRLSPAVRLPLVPPPLAAVARLIAAMATADVPRTRAAA